MSEELKSWTSDRSGNPVDVCNRVPIRSGTTLHGFDAPGAAVPDEVRINGEVFIRKSTSQSRLSEAVKVLEELGTAVSIYRLGVKDTVPKIAAGDHGDMATIKALMANNDILDESLSKARQFLATIGEMK